MAEEALPDVATWDEIKVTALFTSLSTAAFLILFEFSRRVPAVAAVFDRRRASKPHRTPPPLIKSRYFEWLFLSTDPSYCEYADVAEQRRVIREKRRKRKKCGVKGDKSRKKQKMSTPLKQSPQYCSTTTLSTTNSPSHIVDLDDDHNHDSDTRHRHPPTKQTKSNPVDLDDDHHHDDDDNTPHRRPQTIETKSAHPVDIDKDHHHHDDDDDDEDDTPRRRRPLASRTKSVPVDLDDVSTTSQSATDDGDRDDTFDISPSTASRRKKSLAASSKISSGQITCGAISKDTTVMISNVTTTDTTTMTTPSPKKKRTTLRYRSVQFATNEDKNSSNSGMTDVDDNSNPPADAATDWDKLEQGTLSAPPPCTPPPCRASIKCHKRNHSTNSTALPLSPTTSSSPSVVEVNGYRLPGEIAAYAIAGDLTESQMAEYQRRLFHWEEEEEKHFKERVSSEGIKIPFWRYPQFLGFGRNVFRQRRNYSKKLNRSDDGILGGGRGSSSGRDGSSVVVTRSSNRSAVGGGGGSNTAITAATPVANRHLAAGVGVNRRPLNVADTELLRCVGLDTFVMIRFLRFGFDVTFYPFLFACAILLPTYVSNDYGGDEERGIVTSGYFALTMTRLESGSRKLWVPWAFGMVFYVYILRRVWLEWETFLPLRFDFLANGDGEEMDVIVHQDYESERERYRQVKLQLQQFRNSCLVEFVPESHRRDKELYEFFDALFPGQVKRAEILLNASHLTKLMKERTRYIELYENLYAKHFHARAIYNQKIRNEDAGKNNVSLCRYICRWCCCGVSPKEPAEPKATIGRQCGGCTRKMVKALPFYLSEIKRLNRQIDEEHRKILNEKERIEEKDGTPGFIASGILEGVKFVTGGGWDLTCDTGFVEFKSLTAKQSAIQCNIAGTTAYMETISAPDPRDIVWENATVERYTIRWKKIQADVLLFTGTLFWGGLVTLVTSISNLDSLSKIIPSWLIPDHGTFLYSLIQGYLPVVVLELFMIIIPFILTFVATNYIRFKVKSEIEKFVFLWHFAYRLANLLVIIISGSFQESLHALTNNPELFVQNLAAGIGKQSQFFLNNAIVQAGSENMFELAQVANMVKHFVMFKFINVEAKSRRALETLQQAERFNYGDILPGFIFTFMVAMVYCCQVPVVIGACSVVFYLATKVYIHQALFVYAQSYEGGGKLMYPLNRMIFVTLYITICIFSISLGLKEANIQCPLFFFFIGTVTIIVDRKVQQTFVKPSLTLALTNARIIDEENKRKVERVKQYKEYKKMKKEKRRAAHRAAVRAKRLSRDAAGGGGPKQKNVFPPTSSSPRHRSSSSSSSPCANLSYDNDDEPLRPPRDAPTTTRISKGSSRPEKMRERIMQESKQGGNQLFFECNKFDSSGCCDDSDEDVAKKDFYLYRQPQLNKALWETKPRPYR